MLNIKNIFPKDFKQKWMIAFFSLFLFGVLFALSISSYQTYNENISQFKLSNKNGVNLIAQKSLLTTLYGKNDNIVNDYKKILDAFPNIVAFSVYDKKNHDVYNYKRKNEKLIISKIKNINKKYLSSNDIYKKGDFLFYKMPIILKEDIDGNSLSGNQKEKINKYGYVVGVVSSKNMINNLVHTLLNTLLYMGLVMLLIYFLMRYFLNQMADPILEVSKQMDNASHGKRDLDIKLKSRVSEIKTMQDSFLKMIAEIKEREDELKDSRDKAIDFAKKKTEFTATISHEIKTPLNGIIGMLNLIEESEINEGYRENLKIAKESGDLLMTLVEDILNYSKLDTGNVKLIKNEGDLEKAINDTLSLQSKTQYSKNLSINGIFSKNIPKKLKFDIVRVKQLINNLVNNATKFTKDGYVYVKTDMEFLNDRKGIVKIDVVDSGVGIAGEDYEKVFEAYSQKDNTMTRKYGGTGLGLSICKKILEAMDGSIVLNSKVGEGTCFSVRFPVDIIEDKKPYQGFLTAKKALSFADTLDAALLFNSLCDYLNIELIKCSKVSDFESKLKENNFDMVLISAQENKLEIEEMLIDLKREKLFNEKKKIINIKSTFVDTLYGADVDLDSPVTRSSFMQRITDLYQSENNILNFKEKEKKINADEFEHRILIVEDNTVNMKVAQKILNKLGFKNVYLAYNGKEGFEKYKDSKFDLILMDCQMPVMDGFEAASLIRKYEEDYGLKKCPIVALTANSTEDDRKKCYSVGMTDFVGKPVKREAIKNVLEYLLGIDKIKFLSN